MRTLIALAGLLWVLAPSFARATTAADVPCASSSPPNTCTIVVTVSVTTGSVLDFGTRAVVVAASGRLDAGAGSMTIKAASLVLQPGARLLSTGGTIDVTVTGTIAVQTGAAFARIDASGSSGGNVSLTAGGAITIDGQLLADATAAAGDGGEIDVDGAAATLSGAGKISAVGGRSGTGGDVFITAETTDVSLAGTIDVSGLDGGSVTIEGNRDARLVAGGVVNAKSAAGGSGDEVDVTADNGVVVITGDILASSGGNLDFGGNGADVAIEAGTDITVDGTIDAGGAGAGGFGGNIDLLSDTDGDVVVHGMIIASGPGADGFAGAVDAETGRGMIQLTGTIDAVGPAFGGDVTFFSFENVTVSGTITADGAKAFIELIGCDVRVPAGAKLSAAGTTGATHLAASGLLAIAGTVVAGATNRFEFRDPATPPQLTGSITPTPTVTANPALFPCGGPIVTTTTSTTAPTTTSTITTTSTLPATTTSTTLGGPVPTTTTTLGGPVPTTTTTTVVASTTTTATVAPTTTSTLASTTTSTTVASSTTSTVSSTTSTTGSSTTATTVSSTTSTTASPSTTTTVIATTSTTAREVTTTSVTFPVTTTTSPLPGGCSGLVDFDLLSCEASTLSASVDALPPTVLGGADQQQRFSRLLTRVERLIDRAATAQGRLATANPRRSRHLLLRFVHVLERRVERGQIATGVADPLVAMATQLLDDIATVTGVSAP